MKAAQKTRALVTLLFPFQNLIIRRGDSDQSFDGRQFLIFQYLNVTHFLCLLAFLQDQSEIKKWALLLGECSVYMKYSTTQENKPYTNLACLESCFCWGVELAMTKNFSVRRNHSLVVGEITFQVTYMLLYCRIINVASTSRHVPIV